MPDYSPFSALRVERPEESILAIVLDGPNLNAVGAEGHRQLADIWPVIDRDDSVRAVVVSGAGRGFSAGGSFDLIESMVADPSARTRVMRGGPRPRLQRDQLLEAGDLGPSFDASLALEFYGFGQSDVAEGLAAHREKRPPRFG